MEGYLVKTPKKTERWRMDEEWNHSARKVNSSALVVEPEQNASNQEQCLHVFGFDFVRNMLFLVLTRTFYSASGIGLVSNQNFVTCWWEMRTLKRAKYNQQRLWVRWKEQSCGKTSACNVPSSGAYHTRTLCFNQNLQLSGFSLKP